MLIPNKTVGLKGDPCCGGENSRKRITVLLACNINGTDRLLQSLLRKVKAHIAINLLESCHTYVMVWVTQAIFTKYLKILDAKVTF
jgi:hypothetical protein